VVNGVGIVPEQMVERVGADEFDHLRVGGRGGGVEWKRWCPRGGRESQVSVQHALAAALVLGRAGLDQFTDACARDPAVVAMRRKVEVIRDPAITTIAAQVELWTTDGKQHSLSTPAARGSPSNPMSDQDIEDKLRTVADAWCPGHDVGPLIEEQGLAKVVEHVGDARNRGAKVVVGGKPIAELV